MDHVKTLSLSILSLSVTVGLCAVLASHVQKDGRFTLYERISYNWDSPSTIKEMKTLSLPFADYDSDGMISDKELSLYIPKLELSHELNRANNSVLDYIHILRSNYSSSR